MIPLTPDEVVAFFAGGVALGLVSRMFFVLKRSEGR